MNKEIAKKFLESFSGGTDDQFCFQTFDDSGQKNGNKTRVLWGTLDEHYDELSKLNKNGASINVCINKLKGNDRKSKNVSEIRAFFIDKDDGPIEGIDSNNCSLIIDSGKGQHAYWVLKEPIADVECFRKIQESLIRKFKSDKSVKDLARVMRLPGSIHRKDPDNPKETKIILNTGKRFTLDEIKKIADHIDNCDEGKVQEGQRNQFLFNLGAKLKIDGAELEQIEERLKSDNLINCSPPLDDEEVKNIAANIITYVSEINDEEEKLSKRNSSGDLIKIGEKHELFHTGDNNAWALVSGTAFDVGSREFNDFLSREYFKRYKKAPNQNALKEALNVLKGKAKFDGKQRELFKRVAGNNEEIFIDLINADGQQVHITKSGHSVIPYSDNNKFIFSRASGMLELPRPSRNEDINLLKKYLNLKDEDSWILLLSWILSSFFPQGPYVVLVVSGEQGSGKSTTSKFIRSIIDPSFLELRTPPRTEEEIALAASNSWVLAYDNISGIRNELSDALCRVSCNGGFSRRQLYTNGDESLFKYQRPILLNGINDLVTREDLLSRSIIINLPFLKSSNRLSEAKLLDEFKQDLPLILGAIFSSISHGLNCRHEIDFEDAPRMKDFIINSTACIEYFGFDRGAVLKAYQNNKEEFIRYGIESNPVSEGLYKMICEKKEWSGNATQLLSDLSKYVPCEYLNSKYFPKTARRMKDYVRRLSPSLRSLRISCEEYREGGTGQRLIEFRLLSTKQESGE